MELLDRPRAQLAKAVRSKVSGSNFASAHAKIWFTEGERWFSEADAIWRVHADTSMFIGGIRALLLQSLHPVAMLGVSEHSGFRGDPWGRLQRTSHYIATTTYGTIEHAERSIGAVKRVHQRVTGVTSSGKPYVASDPHLLMWVHLAEIDSFMKSHQAFGSEPLSAELYNEYVAQTAVAAEKLGVINAPRSVAELDELLESYRPELTWTQRAQEAADLLIRKPPLPLMARAGYAALAGGAISLLPAWARAQLQLPTLPVADRLLARPLASLAISTIRWALTGASDGETAA